ncbi:sigma-70 family RNA polymerase sigma factor [Flavobacterium sp. I-SCBP12n]|uniref:Sigma-70 family RNA polymerase sigma factor n=2 Tax=Flavobacterium TaxID=237 RepID=A0A9X1XW43_9FLAO|nr:MULTISPECIES: sigma-70 family RNA polymerase sigma factor [Flavobacterium]MBP4142580.1 sigma-70 family RNA polymerase sigma factor [Flavobacterium flabelliforme]MCK8142753.1 sigma-70 family RNA polymerase sigma factor [Flavobacterium pygoscelis]
MKSQDLLILEKLKVGDSSAYKELFDLYYMPLSVYSLKYCDSFELAEDIVQDLFIKFWDKKIYLDLDQAISPYLFKAVKNNSLKAVKKQSKYFFEEIEDQVNVLMEEERLDLEFLEQEKQKLYTEIEALPLKSKEVFKAIVLENQKYKEVALELGISVNTVKTHYSRALKQLRNSLDVIVMLLLV